MTLDELLELPWEQLKALSDKQLHASYAPKFNVTRPELAAKQEKVVAKITEPKKQMILDMKIAKLSPDKQALLKELL